MLELGVTKRFDKRALRIWRTIQIAALLPLTLIGVLMFYFDVMSEFGIVIFFLILILGVVVPQIRGDLILSHFVLEQESQQNLQELKEEILALLDARLADREVGKA